MDGMIMSHYNPFADDWRDSLRAHYMHAVRADDQVTLKSLNGLMHEVGFSDDELRELYVRATMHVDETAPDFVPDMKVLSAEAAAQLEKAIAEEYEDYSEDDDSDSPQQLSMF
jgi:hypothetical protein